jgi:hypothetical protein
MASLAAEPTPLNHSRIFAVRFPPGLQRELETIAQREANSFSATVRRLVTIGLRAEQSRRQEAE